MVFFAILVVVVGVLGWVRLAPSDPAVWHVDPQVSADQDLTNGVRRRVVLGEGGFARLDAQIMATPRTELLAGSPEDGHATYITRSLWMGFPDYTSVQAQGDVLEIWGRARFGRSDVGVNKARVDGWLDQLTQNGA
ncbi:DUF1499 domain-containing protein [Pelagimonas varians]|uniref:DUF1499 domain-containing protein n=1 Tax=Pelagimonas varians TaxID=696760 RepID=A0A238JSV7_9RHOB|nr:DUF1499 domain-containing protein [Pelagimonas varians]PYG34554.1 uncharacterized protein DUF1499 [Pelagimonas varians]SMX33553.1 hypothetical protein PEV8663_00261 [Pelagimonas varians]